MRRSDPKYDGAWCGGARLVELVMVMQKPLQLVRPAFRRRFGAVSGFNQPDYVVPCFPHPDRLPSAQPLPKSVYKTPKVKALETNTGISPSNL